MAKVKHLDGIDEVSAMLGSLKESTKNLEKGQNEIKKMVDCIEKHLRIMNGTISKHQQKMSACDERFSTLDKELNEVKIDKKEQVVDAKTWTRTKIVLFATIILSAIGILLDIYWHFRGG